jgi:Uncharacterized conserved protein
MTDRSKATTHAEACWSWGPAHYKCAMREIERLREELSEVRAELERKDAEIARLRAQLEYTDRYAMDSIRTASRDLDDWHGDMLHLSNSARAALLKDGKQ